VIGVISRILSFVVYQRAALITASSSGAKYPTAGIAAMKRIFTGLPPAVM
jgi:hypothetical protein